MTNLLDIISINSKKSRHISDHFDNCWLARYPRPNRCVHDNGGDSLQSECVQLLGQYGITPVLTTVSIIRQTQLCQTAHQTIGNILCTILHSHSPYNVAQANQIIDNELAIVMHVTRYAVSAGLNTSAGALLFNRYMIMDIPLIADLTLIRNRRQQIIDINLQRENSK